MAITQVDTPATAMALVFLATTFIGYNEALVLPICSIRIKDQQEIGSAVGVAGSARSAISTVASTIYNVVLATRLGQTIPTVVPKALLKAGLPVGSVTAYFEAIAAGGTPEAFAAVRGATPAVQAAGAFAYRVAYLQAYRTIFYTSIGVGVIGIIATCFVPVCNATGELYNRLRCESMLTMLDRTSDISSEEALLPQYKGGRTRRLWLTCIITRVSICEWNTVSNRLCRIVVCRYLVCFPRSISLCSML